MDIQLEYVPSLHVGHNGPEPSNGQSLNESRKAPHTIAQQARKDTRP